MEITSGFESGSNQDGAVARVGAGCTWGEVYSWLEEKKLSAIGGRDQQVGLGGFLTGGRYSLFTPASYIQNWLETNV